MTDIKHKGKYICVRLDSELRELLKEKGIADSVRYCMYECLKKAEIPPETKVKVLYSLAMRYYMTLVRLRKIAKLSKFIDLEIEAIKKHLEGYEEWFEVFGARVKRYIREIEKTIDSITKALELEELKPETEEDIGDTNE